MSNEDTEIDNIRWYCEIGASTQPCVQRNKGHLLLIDKYVSALNDAENQLHYSVHARYKIKLHLMDAMVDELPEEYVNRISAVYLRHFVWYWVYAPRQFDCLVQNVRNILHVYRVCWDMLQNGGMMYVAGIRLRDPLIHKQCLTLFGGFTLEHTRSGFKATKHSGPLNDECTDQQLINVIQPIQIALLQKRMKD